MGRRSSTSRIESRVDEFCRSDRAAGWSALERRYLPAALRTCLGDACRVRGVSPDKLKKHDLDRAIPASLGRLELPDAVRERVPGALADLLDPSGAGLGRHVRSLKAAPPAPARDRRWLRPSYGLGVLVCLFFGLEILPLDDAFIGGIDVTRYFVPNAEFIREQFLSGSFPLWNPYYYCGHPFLANPQTFVLYPATLLFLLAPLPWAFNLDTLLHIYLAGMGTYCFGRLISGSRAGAAVAGLVFALSGYFMENVGSGHLTMIHTAALLPWVFYFFEKGYRTELARWFVAAGFVFGLQVLGGEPQNSFYTAVFLSLYGCARHLLTPKDERLRPLHRLAGRAALIPLVGAGVSAAQILPALEFLTFSDRARNTYEFATFLSFPPRNFYTFLVPKPETAQLNTNWEFGGYVGVLALVLALVGALFSTRRRHVWCLVILAVVAASVMLGQHTPVYRLYFDLLPGFSTFRIPARCLVILVFCLAGLAGLGVQRLCERPLTRRAHLATLATVAVLAGVVAAGAGAFEIPLASGQVLGALGLLAAGAAVLATIRAVGDRRLSVALLVAVPFLDLALHYAPGLPQVRLDDLKAAPPYAAQLASGDAYDRVAVQTDRVRGVRFDHYHVNGYTPIVIGQYFNFVHQMAGLPVPVKRRHTLSHQLFVPGRVFSSRILGIRHARVRTPEGYRVVTAPRAHPRAVLVHEAVEVPEPARQLQILRDPRFDPRRAVLLENVPREMPAGETPGTGTVRIDSYRPNRIELSSEADAAGYLLLSELFYPGWRASVDGAEVPVLRADYLLRAVALEAGRHKIVVSYRPASFLIGGLVTLATWLGLAGLGSFVFRAELRNMLRRRS